MSGDDNNDDSDDLVYVVVNPVYDPISQVLLSEFFLISLFSGKIGFDPFLGRKKSSPYFISIFNLNPSASASKIPLPYCRN
jgi:hypothetical protein